MNNNHSYGVILKFLSFFDLKINYDDFLSSENVNVFDNNGSMVGIINLNEDEFSMQIPFDQTCVIANGTYDHAKKRYEIKYEINDIYNDSKLVGKAVFSLFKKGYGYNVKNELCLYKNKKIILRVLLENISNALYITDVLTFQKIKLSNKDLCYKTNNHYTRIYNGSNDIIYQKIINDDHHDINGGYKFTKKENDDLKNNIFITILDEIDPKVYEFLSNSKSKINQYYDNLFQNIIKQTFSTRIANKFDYIFNYDDKKESCYIKKNK